MADPYSEISKLLDNVPDGLDNIISDPRRVKLAGAVCAVIIEDITLFHTDPAVVVDALAQANIAGQNVSSGLGSLFEYLNNLGPVEAIKDVTQASLTTTGAVIPG